ncbi:MAG: ADP-heptose:LPS heptosyltransferase-like protein [Verrucomicrobiales bacterium]|nr:ADP-heptose:LPS heptosyltransferase-like protein [Verrucomicrobiales bacterium]
MRKVILKCNYSAGDIVMLTASVRDLNRRYPGKFQVDIRTPFSPIWEHNPYITPLDENDPQVETIECSYPLINLSNAVPLHCLHGFAAFLSERLGASIPLTEFKGDIFLSNEEKNWMSQVHELTGQDTPFWIIVAGGKFDVPIKWWDKERYQEVVDHFRGRIQFVQVGDSTHYHPELSGVIDLRGRTGMRQLIRLVYHAQGVLCPVTALMHLAAAVEIKHSTPQQKRACVVVAGGREPAHWEAYPNHQFIHTNGALSCCLQGGCWKSRVVPLHDGDKRDQNLCLDVVDKKLPRCMDMITAQHVINRIEWYFQGGALDYLSRGQAHAAKRGARKIRALNKKRGLLTMETALSESELFIRRLPEQPPAMQGRGIVVCGGGVKYFTIAWVCIRMLRHWGCKLPVQLWHLGTEEMDARMKDLLTPFDVECVDALEVRKRVPARMLTGYGLKPFALLHNPYREVILLDSDNVPLFDPERLFETPEYENVGALFWPDYGRLAPSRAIWHVCGVPYRDEPEFESGQIVVDKSRCWKALYLSMWYNEHADFYYRLIHGDKDTFHMAFRKLEIPYAMPYTPIQSLEGVMCQHDFQGNRIFQHRNSHKWTLAGPDKQIAGFLHEDLCIEFLNELRQKWDGIITSE